MQTNGSVYAASDILHKVIVEELHQGKTGELDGFIKVVNKRYLKLLDKMQHLNSFQQAVDKSIRKASEEYESRMRTKSEELDRASKNEHG